MAAIIIDGMTDIETTLLAEHLAATAGMMGLIWFAQLLHYPLFEAVLQPARGSEQVGQATVRPLPLLHPANRTLDRRSRLISAKLNS